MRRRDASINDVRVEFQAGDRNTTDRPSAVSRSRSRKATAATSAMRRARSSTRTTLDRPRRGEAPSGNRQKKEERLGRRGGWGDVRMIVVVLLLDTQHTCEWQEVFAYPPAAGRRHTSCANSQCRRRKKKPWSAVPRVWLAVKLRTTHEYALGGARARPGHARAPATGRRTHHPPRARAAARSKWLLHSHACFFYFPRSLTNCCWLMLARLPQAKRDRLTHPMSTAHC
jgi:hypothetical protein